MEDVKIAFGINYEDQSSFQVAPFLEVARALRAEQGGGGCILVGNIENGESIMKPFDYSEQAEFEKNIRVEIAGILHGEPWDSEFEQSRRVYGSNGVSPTVHTMGGGGQELKIMEERPINDYYLSEKGKAYVLNSKRGMCTDINADEAQPLTAQGQQNWTGSFISPEIDRISKSSEIGSTKPTQIHLKNGETISSADKESLVKYRIRKFTEKECFRLMGVKDEDFAKLSHNQSSSSLYHLAGDSIVTSCLMGIFGELLGIDCNSKIDELIESIAEKGLQSVNVERERESVVK